MDRIEVAKYVMHIRFWFVETAALSDGIWLPYSEEARTRMSCLEAVTLAAMKKGLCSLRVHLPAVSTHRDVWCEERCRNYSDGGNKSTKKLVTGTLVHRKSDVDCAGMELGPPWWEADV
jgi:hypothetical protein